MQIIDDTARKLHCSHGQVFVFYAQYCLGGQNFLDTANKLILEYNRTSLIPPPMVDWLVDILVNRIAILPKDIPAWNKKKPYP
jgi:hypothetical protein